MAVKCRAVLVALAFMPSVVLGQSRGSSCKPLSVALLGAQITFIGQELRPFHASYGGPMSLADTGDRQLSQSYGIYGGACLTAGFALYLDAEMIRGSGISHASGVGGVTNGDVLRQGSVDLGNGPYIARLFARWTLPLWSPGRDTITAAVDAMPTVVSDRRIEISAGRFAVTDVLDLNRYANSTRTQFLDWVLFNDGAWDYAANTRGYSNGVAVAWITPGWALRAGSFQMPTFANGNTFDNDLANARGDNVELTVTVPYNGIVRLLLYDNHARMGRYAVTTETALARGVTPNIVADDAPGRTKYGIALNGELALADQGETGVFARLGWNDGRNESFAFTEVDRLVSAGTQLSGTHWSRAGDDVGVAFAADGISGAHRDYLAAGGSGFLLGDGALRYGHEVVTEAYYSARFGQLLTVSPDVIRIANPGYNRDRGPAVVLSLRANVRR